MLAGPGPSSMRKSSIEPTNANNSPSANAASYFNSNFDENGYVFDGIKIDVLLKLSNSDHF